MRTARARVSSSNFPSAPMAPVSLLDRSLSHTQGDSKARRAALQMLRAQIISAPEELRDQVRNLTRMQLIRTCAAWRPDVSDAADAVTATRIALKSLARRILDLGDEISMLDELITPLVTDLAPRLLERPGIGIEIAGQLLVTAGDNPQRCAASPRLGEAPIQQGDWSHGCTWEVRRRDACPGGAHVSGPAAEPRGAENGGSSARRGSVGHQSCDVAELDRGRREEVFWDRRICGRRRCGHGRSEAASSGEC